MTSETTGHTPTFGEYARYFLPLAFQSASQGLTYPLVAMVASRGPGGPLNLAGLAQSHTVMFMLGTLGFGLVTTGMVFGRSLEGYARFRAVTRGLGLVAIAVQALLGIPVLARWLFEGLIGLPPSIADPAQVTLLASIPLQWLFFLRIPYQVCLYNARAAFRATLPTVLRILLTALLALVCCEAGIVGPFWAIAVLTVPVALEVEVSRRLAAPFLARLEPSGEPPPRHRELVGFNLPLSLGGYLLSLAAIILGAFIARAAEPERMLPAYYLALGLVTPLAYGATRIQQVVLAFPAPSGRHRHTLGFALVAGLALGLLPLAAILPGLAELYYVRFQNLALPDLPLVRLAALALVVYPMCVALRAHGEGLASLARQPLTVIAGHAVFAATVLLSASALLVLGVPGHLMGGICLSLANLASAGTLRRLLKRFRQGSLPVAETTTAAGQIR
jgi:hypothetical protein